MKHGKSRRARWLNITANGPISLNNLTPEEYRLMAEKPKLSKSA